MSVSENTQVIHSVAQIISGAGMGVTIESSEVTDVKLLTTINNALKDGERTKSFGKVVEILSEVVLDYEAGYKVRFTTSLESKLPSQGDNKMVSDIAELVNFIKSEDNSLWFDLYSASLNLEPFENISLLVENEAVLDYITQNHCYEDDDSDDGVISIKFDGDCAECWQGEVQTQFSGYSTGGDEHKLSAELVAELKAQVSSKAIDFLS